jgi:hypothetical protein
MKLADDEHLTPVGIWLKRNLLKLRDSIRWLRLAVIDAFVGVPGNSWSSDLNLAVQAKPYIDQILMTTNNLEILHKSKPKTLRLSPKSTVMLPYIQRTTEPQPHGLMWYGLTIKLDDNLPDDGWIVEMK